MPNKNQYMYDIDISCRIYHIHCQLAICLRLTAFSFDWTRFNIPVLNNFNLGKYNKLTENNLIFCGFEGISLFKIDSLVKSQNSDGKEKSSSSRRANLEE